MVENLPRTGTIGFMNFLKIAMVRVLRATFGHESTPEIFRYNQDKTISKISIYRIFPREVLKYPSLIINAEAADASLTSLGREKFKEEKNSVQIKEQEHTIPAELKIYPVNIDTSKTPTIIDKNNRLLVFELVLRNPQTNQFILNQLGELEFNSADIGRQILLTYYKWEWIQKFTGSLTVPLKINILCLDPQECELITDLITLYLRTVWREKFLQEGIVFTKIKINGESQSTMADGRPLFTNSVTIDCYSEYESQIDYSLAIFIRNLNINFEVIENE